MYVTTLSVLMLILVSMFVGVCLWELTKYVIGEKRGRLAQDIADMFSDEEEKK